MKKTVTLLTLMLALVTVSVTTMVSCTKSEISAVDIGTEKIAAYEATVANHMTGPANFADAYVLNHIEESVMSESTFRDLCDQITVFSDEALKECLRPGEIPLNTPEAVEAKYNILKAEIASRDLTTERVETIIQLSPTKRIIDATANELALTIANYGQTVTSGPNSNISYDYHRSAQNRITNLDIALANWALMTTNQTGSTFVADDDYIEVFDPLNFPFEVSGGNYFAEAVIQYNGPDIDFSYFDVQTQQVETIPIASGELLVYDNTDSQFGTLFFNLTLINEIPESPTYVDAVLQGPIPGMPANQGISFTGGPWPVVTEPA